MSFRLLFIIGFSVVSLNIAGQLKNFGSRAVFTPQTKFLYSVYVYGDLVREAGLGFQYQLLAKYNVDVSAYLIDPNPYFKDKIQQWDYYDLKGYGFSLKPKFQVSKLGRFYVSPNLSYERLHHDKVWVEYYYGKGSDFTHQLETATGSAFTIGITLGNKLTFTRFFAEPFFGIGLTSSVLQKTVYAYDKPRHYQSALPNSFKEQREFFQMNIGLKIGLSFKKSKRHAAIDKKFDEVYIPKAKNIADYLERVDFKSRATSKYRRQAKVRFEHLNMSILRRHRRYYGDTTLLYQKTDILFGQIESLLIKSESR